MLGDFSKPNSSLIGGVLVRSISTSRNSVVLGVPGSSWEFLGVPGRSWEISRRLLRVRPLRTESAAVPKAC